MSNKPLFPIPNDLLRVIDKLEDSDKNVITEAINNIVASFFTNKLLATYESYPTDYVDKIESINIKNVITLLDDYTKTNVNLYKVLKENNLLYIVINIYLIEILLHRMKIIIGINACDTELYNYVMKQIANKEIVDLKYINSILEEQNKL